MLTLNSSLKNTYDKYTFPKGHSQALVCPSTRLSPRLLLGGICFSHIIPNTLLMGQTAKPIFNISPVM